MRRFLCFNLGWSAGSARGGSSAARSTSPVGLFVIGLLAVAALAPAPAAADYLYGLNKETGAEPYVLLIADNSGSMLDRDAGTDCCACSGWFECSTRCWRKPTCQSRIEVLKDTLTGLVPTLDNVVLGLSKYGEVGSGAGTGACRSVITNPLPNATQDQLLQSIGQMVAKGWTPIGLSLKQAREHLVSIRNNDSAGSCRPYAVVLLTDGLPQCNDVAADIEAQKNDALKEIRDLKAAGIPTYVVGFGKDVKGSPFLDEMARAGGTARQGTNWCGNCGSGRALFPEDATALREALDDTFGQIRRGQYTVMPPMVATVPQVKSEYDRVANNFLAYSAFEMPGHKGRLYGMRLYEEDEDEVSVWRFTDLSAENEDFNLNTCGAEGNPCVFEAGALLQARTEQRNIYFSYPASTDKSNDGLVLKMAPREKLPALESERQYGAVEMFQRVLASDSPLRPGVDALSSVNRATLEALADQENAQGKAWRTLVAKWIDGAPDVRPSRLGDIYHSAPAIVTHPPYSYRGYGYPIFKAKYRQRASMIYVGANDGQIHAFHASDDHFPPDEGEGEDAKPGTPRWRAGEEAWSYVPFNMLAKVALAAVNGEKRVFSQDLSCRVDDVVAYPTFGGEGEIDCTLDPEHEKRGTCGWRTVLVCGQGWGGSWYVAMDVSDPLDPRPMWEATHLGDKEYGLGRTWIVPSVGAVNMEAEKDGKKYGIPTWLSIYGSGYNTLLKDHAGNRSPAYRYLNMSFAGAYPEHGAGIKGEKGNIKDPTAFVFVQDMVSGKYLKRFAMEKQYGVTADIPLVATKDRFFVNVGYVGGWQGGTLGRIAFPTTNGTTKPSDWSYCPEVLAFSESKPLTSRPSAFSDPLNPEDIYLFVGSGLDPGSDPDQQANQGKMWEFQAFRFTDEGTAACPSKVSSNICTSGSTLKNIFNDGNRLIAPPTLTVQRDFKKHLSFTTWMPEGGPHGCGGGKSYLYCLDVTAGANCTACPGLGTEGDGPRIALGQHKSQTPVTADGQTYVIGDDGTLLRIKNQDGTGTGIGGGGGPGQNAPRAMILSWREIF